MCLVYAVNIADRYVVSSVLEPIRIQLHLTDAGVAFLMRSYRLDVGQAGAVTKTAR